MSGILFVTSIVLVDLKIIHGHSMPYSYDYGPRYILITHFLNDILTAKVGRNSYNLEAALLYFQQPYRSPLQLLHMVNSSIHFYWVDLR